MAIGFKKVFAGFLLTIMLASTASAHGNYTQVQAVEEYYNASSPVGTFVQYPEGATSTYNTGYVPVNFSNTVLSTTTPTVVAPIAGQTYTQPMPASYQKIEVPQNYDKKIVTTNTYVDQRETIDKVIDRSGKVVGILGIGALLGVGVAAIISAF